MMPNLATDGETPTLSVILDEHDAHNRAIVRLSWRGTSVVGRGRSRLGAGDEVEGPGQKLALARALSDLTRQVFVDVAGEIEAATALRFA